MLFSLFPQQGGLYASSLAGLKHLVWSFSCNSCFHACRRHFLQCPSGLLSKHFEKLLMCDPRLNLLSQRPEIVLDSPFFEPKASVFEEHDESKCHRFDNLTSYYVSSFVSFQDALSQSAAQPSSCVTELKDPIGGATEAVPHGTPSPSSGLLRNL